MVLYAKTGRLHINIILSNLNILIVYVTFHNSNFYFIHNFLATSAIVDWSQGHWKASDPGNTYVKLPLICEFYLAGQGKLETWTV